MFKDQITNYLKFDKKKITLNKIDRMVLSMIRTKTENKPGVLCIKSLLTLTSLKTRIRVELSLSFLAVQEQNKQKKGYTQRETKEINPIMEKSVLDYVLVPSGLVVMVSYHIWLLYRILKHPNNTIIGINAVNRRFWVRAMMEVYTYVTSMVFTSYLFLLSHYFHLFTRMSL